MDWKRKLTSRKFWSAVAGFVSMLVIAMQEGIATPERITALIMAGGSLIAYIIGEGMTDAASVEQTYVIPESTFPDFEDYGEDGDDE